MSAAVTSLLDIRLIGENSCICFITLKFREILDFALNKFVPFHALAPLGQKKSKKYPLWVNKNARIARYSKSKLKSYAYSYWA